MKSPFDITNDILFTKKNERLLPGDDPNPFLINKIISYQNPAFCQLVNNTTNVYHGVLDTQQFVDFLRLVFPKNKWKRLDWIAPKKEKAKVNLETPIINQLCQNMEISKKELEGALEIFPDVLKSYHDEEKIYKKLDNRE